MLLHLMKALLKGGDSSQRGAGHVSIFIQFD